MPTAAEWFAQAAGLQRAGKLPEAVTAYRQVVAVEPRHALAWHQLGCLATYANHYDEAVTNFTRAILLDGRQAAFHHNLGSCFRVLGRLSDARASYQRALALDPNYQRSRIHLTFTLLTEGRRAEALAYAAQIDRRQLTAFDEHADLGELSLLLGDFAVGWEEFEYRLQAAPMRERTPPGPKWNGESLIGKTLLVYADQGLGDTLQMVRYLPELAKRGGRVVAAVQPTLHQLLQQRMNQELGIEGSGLEFWNLGEDWPEHDFQVALFSLPGVLGTTLESVPSGVPYLAADGGLIDRWKGRLADLPGRRVGICWQGNSQYRFDRWRSIPLAAFAPLGEVEGVSLISLQKGFGSEQLSSPSNRLAVVDLGAELDNQGDAFVDTSAVLTELDLLITSDTAIAHLAGALGVPVWLAVNAMPDWRWLLDRNNNPWYPTMELYRQTKLGDWSGVFAEMVSDLAKLGR